MATGARGFSVVARNLPLRSGTTYLTLYIYDLASSDSITSFKKNLKTYVYNLHPDSSLIHCDPSLNLKTMLNYVKTVCKGWLLSTGNYFPFFSHPVTWLTYINVLFHNCMNCSDTFISCTFIVVLLTICCC